jgi:GNAT superfamily N-acetyltransferase
MTSANTSETSHKKPAPKGLRLRSPNQRDAEAAGAICYNAFKTIAERHGFPPDFPDAASAIGLIKYLVAAPDIHGFVAEVDGRVVGSNFLWTEEAVAGVGPITIDPAVQNGGVGRRLMEAVTARAHSLGIPSVRLVQAAYHGRSLSLYTKLGFDVREPLSIMQGPALNLRIDGCAPYVPRRLTTLTRQVRSAGASTDIRANGNCVLPYRAVQPPSPSATAASPDTPQASAFWAMLSARRCKICRR